MKLFKFYVDFRKATMAFMFFLITAFPVNSLAQDPAITKLFEDSYHLWELMRNNKGVYRDSKVVDGSEDFHPASVANVGVGLVSLCIADAMGWDSNAADKALVTLNSMTGHTEGFVPERSANGYFRHFINMETGVQEWNSEFSTIDTDILMIGAIFAKNYFSGNSLIASRVDELWNSIDFTAAIANASAGDIYLTINQDGSGSGITKVYNEYMLVAWLALNDTKNNTAQAETLWNNWYGNPSNLPKSTFDGYDVPTDDHGESRFLSAFTHQFNYYYINFFQESAEYMQLYNNSKDAELSYWSNKGAIYEWGNGAGVDVDGYKANNINSNSYLTVSPHIIAGYIPIEPDSKSHLLSLLSNNKGVYSLPDDASKKTLWRYSQTDPNWRGNSIQGIDQSTLLYGLASLPEYLGVDFFKTYNDLNYDGGATPNPPVADFSANATSIAEGDSVSFTDLSTNIPTSWSWSFVGGTPTTSTSQNPSVVYNTNGTYEVALTATNADGSDTETKIGYITVSKSPSCPIYAIAGTIQAEDYCAMSGVQGSPVGWIDAGDWMEYEVNVAEAGEYIVDVMIASLDGNDIMDIQMDGQSVGTLNVVSTGAWNTYEIQSTTVNLTAGNQTLRIYATTGGYNLDYFTFTLNNSGETDTWDELNYENFEGGWGQYISEGADALLYTGGTYAHQGTNAADIQDNSGSASTFTLKDGINVSGYEQLKIEFWFKAISMDNTKENFYIEYYDGADWIKVGDFAKGLDFENGIFYNKVIYIKKSDGINFPINSKIRFTCDASGNADDVYIDEIKISGTTSTTLKSFENNTQQETIQSKSDGFQPLSVNIYPNPVSGGHFNITISNVKNNAIVNVYTVTGEHIYNKVVNGESTFAISSDIFKSGNLYLIKIQSGIETITKKLIIK